jgi:hypothetical protein
MGYYIFSYGIDALKVKNIIGGKDPDLFEAVSKTDEFDLYASQDFAGHTTTRQALEQIVLGKRHSLLSKYNKDSAHAYWYAFIAICGLLGERMPSSHEIKLSYETDLINKYLRTDFGVNLKIDELLIIGEDYDFGLPHVQDWPMCGLWTRQQLSKLKNTFAPVNITDTDLARLAEIDEEKGMAYDSIRQTKENILYCLDNQLDLISFCH